MRIYLIGSLRNPEIPNIANSLRAYGYDVFDDWFAAGPTADDEWKRYEQTRGRTYAQALEGLAARHIYTFDLENIMRSDVGVLAAPAGRSGHLELGYMLGRGKPGFVLLDSDRWDVMYQLATGVASTVDELIELLAR